MRHLYIFLIACFSISLSASAQEITEENYLKLDKEIWDKYQRDADSINAAIEKSPEKKDSLMAEWDELRNEANKRNIEAAIKYASVPSGLQRVFMVRLNLPKDTLSTIVNSLTPEMRNSAYGKSIQMHIDTEQIEKGSKYYDFEGTDSDGKPFRLSSIKSKKILLLYGGLGCMGKERREDLQKIYEKKSRDDFQVVVYWLSSDLERLKKLKEIYPSDYIFVSDFLGDHTPVKVIYGAQATPTCFLIDENRIVIDKCVGWNTDHFTKILLGGN